jgi:hypothetical protein
VPTLPLHTPIAPAPTRRASSSSLISLHACTAGQPARRPFGRLRGLRAQQPSRCPVCDALDALSRNR